MKTIMKYAFVMFVMLPTLAYPGRFEYDNDEIEKPIVEDLETGLVWTRNFGPWATIRPGYNPVYIKKIEDLERFVDAYSAHGYSDWRMPTVKELRTISLTGGIKNGWVYNPFKNMQPTYTRGYYYPSRSAGFLTSEDSDRFRYMTKVYYPYSDAVSFQDKYFFDDWQALRLVHGNFKGSYTPTEPVPRKAKWNPLDEIGAFGRAHFLGGRLIPKDIALFPLMNCCPPTPFEFVWASKSEIQKLDVATLDKGHIPSFSINKWKVCGLTEYFDEWGDLNPFKKKKRLPEAVNKILKVQDEYISEYQRYMKSVFILDPESAAVQVKLENYNIDNETLTIKLENNHTISYDSLFGVSSDENHIKNMPHDSIDVEMDMDVAETLFSSDQEYQCYSSFYVKPAYEDKHGYDYRQTFHPVLIAVDCYIADENIFSVFMKDFFYRVPKRNNSYGSFTWKSEVRVHPPSTTRSLVRPQGSDARLPRLVGRWKLSRIDLRVEGKADEETTAMLSSSNEDFRKNIKEIYLYKDGNYVESTNGKLSDDDFRYTVVRHEAWGKDFVGFLYIDMYEEDGKLYRGTNKPGPFGILKLDEEQLALVDYSMRYKAEMNGKELKKEEIHMMDQLENVMLILERIPETKN